MCAVLATLLAASISPSTLGQRPIGVDEALSRARWEEADQVVGSVAIISGKISSVGSTSNGRVNFLNFDPTRRDVFKVVIFDSDAKNFPRPFKDLYDQQLVSVRGEVTLYRGVPQIRVRTMDQIRIVDRLPPSRIRLPVTRSVGNQIRVASFNIRNLFDDVDDPYFMDETTNAKPRQELVRVADSIKKLNADVVALQEVESRGYLQRFDDVFLHDLGYEVVHYAGNDRRGSGLAVLTRIPVGQVISNRHRSFAGPDGEMTRFSRDLLCVELLPTAASKPFEVWVTHLKSKREGPEVTEPKRLAEVTEIRRLFEARLQRDPEARILICGDFNDTFDSKPIRTLIGDGELVKHFVDTVPDGSVTYNLDPYQAMIDFIFCSKAAAAAYVDGSYRIESQTLDQSGSDHNPVLADFRF